jgi:GNAT superfamily N-acetyltransferase
MRPRRKLAVMSVTFTELGPAEFRSAIDGFVAVYAAAMNPPDRMLAGREAILDRHAANPGFRALAALVLPGGDDRPSGTGAPAPMPPGETPGGAPDPRSYRAREAPGFSRPEPPAGRSIFGRVGRAREAAEGSRSRLVGFTYGFHGTPGQWWHDIVAGALAQGRGSRAPGPGGAGWLDDTFEVAELHVLPAYQGKGTGRGLLFRLTADRPERTAVLSTADTESRARRLYRGAGFTDLLTAFRFAGGEPPYAVMGATLPLRCSPRGDDRS